jgi:tryptophan 6-halogenase
MKEPFPDMSDHLLNESAVADQVPNDDKASSVAPPHLSHRDVVWLD